MTNEIEKVEKLIDDYNSLIDNHFKVISDFLSNKDLIEIAKKYREEMSNPPELGFNLFNMISEIYYRENLHSDIIARILDINGSHGEGNKFLFLFIDFLNEMNSKTTIDKTKFEDAEVFREKGRIDISIISRTSKQAIIVENKINGAVDQHRQIPRYCEYIEGIGLKTVSVVYLGLRNLSKPNQNDWTENEKKYIDNVLTVVNVVEECEKNLIKGWLDKCEEAATNKNAKFVIKQYVELLNYLGGKTMDEQLMKRFYDFVIKDDNLKTIESVIGMRSQLVAYRQKRAINNNYAPFKTSRIEYDRIICENFEKENSNFRMDIVFADECTVIQVWDINDKYGTNKKTNVFFEKLNMGFNFINSNSEYWAECVFKFPDEEQKFDEFLKSFLEAIIKIQNT